MKRSTIKPKREAFTLNVDNPKEKIILDYLETIYNKSDFIKEALYKIITGEDGTIIEHRPMKPSVPTVKKSKATKIEIEKKNTSTNEDINDEEMSELMKFV